MNKYFIIAVVWLSSLVLTGLWQRHDGATAVEKEWAEKENATLIETNKKILSLEGQYTELKTAYTIGLSNIASDYEKELKNVKIQRDKDVAAAYTGGLRLRYKPITVSSASTGTQVESSTCKCNGGEGIELPGEITANLFQLANDADEITYQLRAAQAVIKEDRKLCGEKIRNP